MVSGETTYFTVFNKQAEDFFKNIIDGFPSTPEFEIVKKEFRSLKGGFSMLKTISEKQPQLIFKEYIVKEYRDKILNKDESFFLDKKYDITSKQKDYWIEFIANIKKIWITMDDRSKENMWNFFTLLVYLSDKCDNNS